MRLFGGKTRILVPTFVEELVRTVRQIAPGQRGDRINHLPKPGLRIFDLIPRCSESVLSSLTFNRYAGYVRCPLDQSQILFGGTSRLGRIERESAEYFV